MRMINSFLLNTSEFLNNHLAMSRITREEHPTNIIRGFVFQKILIINCYSLSNDLAIKSSLIMITRNSIWSRILPSR